MKAMKAMDVACEGKSEAEKDAAFALLPSIPVVLLELQPGDMVVMHGYCVHAGYKPRPGAPDFRAHWYCQMEGSEDFVYNTTYNIEGHDQNPLRSKICKRFLLEKVRATSLLGTEERCLQC